VVVPDVIAPLTTRRVLTMAHHPAVRVTDREALRRLGVDPREVLEILARAYAKQVFVDGLFHADPHPGNLFVIDEPEARARPRVLFVDFGLSKRLAPALRREMRLAIFALLRGDLEGFLGGMQRLDMFEPPAREGVARAVSSMLERLRAEGAAPLALSGDRVLALKDEAKRLLEETPGLQLPNDLLLYAKTVSHLFGLGRELAPELDLMKLSVPYLLRFLATPEA
jgi:ubiquinone biosynthesis protein